MNLTTQLNDCFKTLEGLFNPETMEEFLNTSYANLADYHFGLGLWLRNNPLDKGQPLFNHLRRLGIDNKDDMSALIIRLFYLYMHAKQSPLD